MKRAFKLLGISLFIAFGILFSSSKFALASDVWVYTSAESNYMVYVVTESIVSDGRNDAKVTTKRVRNGQLLETIKWDFYRSGNQWRYETSKMRGGHDTVVIAGGEADRILQFTLGYALGL